MIVAFSPSIAHAQFGRLKKLKEKFSAPDSAARAKDSLDPMSIGAQALANAKMTAQQHAMQKATGGKVGGPGLSGMAGAGMNAAQMQAMQRAAMSNATSANANRAAMANAMAAQGAAAGYSQADID